MRSSQSPWFRSIILVSGVLCGSTGLLATTVDPGKQFLDLANATDERLSVLSLDEEGLIRAVTGAEFVVGPRERRRIPDALTPGYKSLVFCLGHCPLKGSVDPEANLASKWIKTEGLQVSNFANKTFLRGKLLTVFDKEDFSVESVRLLDGVWNITKVDPRGTLHEYELNISHSEPHFSGSFTYVNTGERTSIDGTMGDQMITFKIHMPVYADPDDLRPETCELRVQPSGIWEGYFNASYVEEGERVTISAPMRFEADFEKKELVYREYDD